MYVLIYLLYGWKYVWTTLILKIYIYLAQMFIAFTYDDGCK